MVQVEVGRVQPAGQVGEAWKREGTPGGPGLSARSKEPEVSHPLPRAQLAPSQPRAQACRDLGSQVVGRRIRGTQEEQ